MKSLRHRVIALSLAGLALLGGLYVLVNHELDAWSGATAYVMRDYRRAVLDGELHTALTRAVGEAASYVLTRSDTYRAESVEALERANEALAKLRRIAEEGPPAAGDRAHVEFLARQQRLLGQTEDILRRAMASPPGASGPGEADTLREIYRFEGETDALWRDVTSHHNEELEENARSLIAHGQRAHVIFLSGVVAFVVAAGLLLAYVQVRVVRPLATLARLTRSVSAGDLTHRVPVTHGDEIGELQSSYNQMVEDLDQRRLQVLQLIERLAASRDAAQAASGAKSDFLANVSHEIRTPMNGILIGLDLLIEASQSREQRDLAVMLRSSARQLVGMLNDLLEFSRIEAGRLELESVAFEPHALVTQMVELHGKRAAAKGVSMSCRIADDVPKRLRGDPTRIGQILLNLLDNAIKYTDRGSIGVSVSLEASPSAPAAAPRPPEGSVWLRFLVTDTGAGIPAEHAQDIFQPFSRGAGPAALRDQGLGLGLSIARELARLMGGTLAFESEVGKGSSFWFTVRLSAEIQPLPEPAARPQLPAGKAVLLVDDHHDTREIMSRLLERRGLHVATAEDGRAALALAGARKFDLILMDCRMPGMDGFEATRAIRASAGENAQVPIVALTAYGLSGSKEPYLENGFDDLLIKPYTLEEIEDLLYRWLVATPGRATPGANTPSA